MDGRSVPWSPPVGQGQVEALALGQQGREAAELTHLVVAIQLHLGCISLSLLASQAQINRLDEHHPAASLKK